MHILLINGPNLNLLGQREPAIYGHETLDEILYGLAKAFPAITLTHFQSNHEGALIDKLQELTQPDSPIQGLIINAGALSHTSYAIYDTLRTLKQPIVEVHLSNIYARENFRAHSLLSQACKGVISGFGAKSYSLAVEALLHSAEL